MDAVTSTQSELEEVFEDCTFKGLGYMQMIKVSKPDNCDDLV